MPKFRKKPVVIEARQFVADDNKCRDALVLWINQGRDTVGAWQNGTHIFIHTLEGEHRAIYGDWIIKGVKGEFYPCKPDIFEATYEEVPEPHADDPPETGPRHAHGLLR